MSLNLCRCCFTEGDFATLSRDKEQVIRRGSEIRAEMSYPEGLSFGHVLRILSIIHEVSPNYFLIGVSAHTQTLKSNDPELYVRVSGQLLVLRLGHSRDARFPNRAKTHEERYLGSGKESALLRPPHH